MKFSENLKYLRKEANLTQEELAEQLNVSRQAITKWESGQSMPDIENLKELSYIFSIPVDNLIGDIECKSSLEINKKIKDIGWFIFGFVILYIFITMSITSFLTYIFNNTDITFPIVAIMIILGIVIFTITIKRWLKQPKAVIINLTETNEGKKERRKFLVKRWTLQLIIYNIVMLMLNLPTEAIGFEFFVSDIITNLLTSIIIVGIIGYFDCKHMKEKVKEFNKNI